MNAPVIEFFSVNKSYGDKTVLNNLNFAVKAGEFVTVLGPSGSGKTTVLKMINGLSAPDSGTVRVLDGVPSGREAVSLRRKIGYVVQETSLFPHMNVYRNIAYVPGLLKWNRKKMEKRTEELINTMGLQHSMLRRFPHELSGGERQRVGIARALAARPEIMLMDEPFASLDESSRTALQDEIKKIWENDETTIFFITHDTREAEKLGSRVMVMNGGVLIEKS